MAAKKRYLFRYLLIAMVFCTVCVVYLGRLFYVQITGRESSYRSETTVTVKVPAVRGEILDRNGTLLVGNRYTYDLTLSHTSLAAVGTTRANQIYLQLFAALDSCSARDTHTEKYFPLQGTYPDYIFSKEASDTSTAVGYRYQRLLKEKGMDTDTTVDELVKEYTDTYRLLETADGSHLYSDYEVDRLLRLHYDMDAMQFSPSTPYVFAEKADLALMTYVREMSLSGISFSMNTERYYAYPGYASHILGSVGPIYAEEWDYYNEQGYEMNAIVGKSGCESAFENYLHGTDGTSKLTLDSAGNVIRSEVITPPVSGQDVYLTINIELQIAAEDALAENVQYVKENDSDAVPGFESDSGAAVAMDPNTFDILAIASYPTFDLTVFNQSYDSLLADPARPLFNRTLQEIYAPGSTFKPGVALAGLNEGSITAASTVFCDGAFPAFGDGYAPKCSTHYLHGTGNLTVTQSIAVSCNCFFYDLGLKLGISRMDSYMSALGFGQKTGIELREETGVLAGVPGSYSGTWYDGDTVQASIGQSDTRATPLQICTYAATLANGGTRYSAHLLDRVSSFGSDTPTYTDEALLQSPLASLQLSSSALSTVLNGMKQMIAESTTARRFLSQSDVDYTTVGGKTGTAQLERYVLDPATGEYTKYIITNALFVGIAPIEQPEIAVSVVIEKASSGTLASLTAARIIGAWEDLRDGKTPEA